MVSGYVPWKGWCRLKKLQDMLEVMRSRGGYISTRRSSDGSDTPYELNISYFDAFRPTQAGAGGNHIAAFLLSQTIALSFKGIPAVYIHSLLASPNDTMGVERTGLTRAVNRRQWDRGELEGLMANHQSETGRVFQAYRHLLQIRKRQPPFHPDAPQTVLELANGLFGLHRVARWTTASRLYVCLTATPGQCVCRSGIVLPEVI